MEISNIKKGMMVEILTKRNKLSRGIVEDVATKPNRLKGTLVRLINGDLGRVQKILNLPEKQDVNLSDLDELLKKGESFFCEFKGSALWSQDYTEEDIQKSRSLDVHYYKKKASRIIIAKSIAAFLNSEGGNLIIGIKEKKDDELEIKGIEEEFKKLKDAYKDGYKRMIIDEIIKPYFPPRISDNLNKYIQIDFVQKQGKQICWLRINKSENRVFLNLNGKDVFMIRTETENRMLEGEKLVDYCIRHF